jgi:hypothetical protein
MQIINNSTKTINKSFGGEVFKIEEGVNKTIFHTVQNKLLKEGLNIEYYGQEGNYHIFKTERNS